MRFSNLFAFLALLVTLTLAACGKNETAATEEISPETAIEIEAQVPAAAKKSGPTIQDRLEGEIHPELTALLHMFVERYKRMPENFYEFSNAMMDSVPPLPPGMKYEIDPADKSVKITKK